jgi:hypothetical protein
MILDLHAVAIFVCAERLNGQETREPHSSTPQLVRGILYHANAKTEGLCEGVRGLQEPRHHFTHLN